MIYRFLKTNRFKHISTVQGIILIVLRIVVFAKEVMILMLSQYFFVHINKKCDIMKSRR